MIWKKISTRTLVLLLAMFFAAANGAAWAQDDDDDDDDDDDAAGPKLELKIATLVPQGTVWAREMVTIQKEIEKATGGDVGIRVFYGGSKGTEKNMINLMKSGALDGASFTGIGLGEIVPAIALLQLPMFLETDQQVDRVRAGLTPYFNEEFEKKGFKFLGWGEIGWVYFFSKKKVETMDDFKGMKIWAPEGDELVKAMLAKINVVPYQYPIPAVFSKLQTGQLDGVVNSPTGLVGLQWNSYVKFMAGQKLANGVGGTLFTKKAWGKIPAKHHAKIESIMEASSKRLISVVRGSNVASLGTLSKSLTATKIDEANMKILREKSMQVQNDMAGRLYPKAILDKARSLK